MILVCVVLAGLWVGQESELAWKRNGVGEEVEFGWERRRKKGSGENEVGKWRTEVLGWENRR